jgi:ataxia telangiectasia mutated family protein
MRCGFCVVCIFFHQHTRYKIVPLSPITGVLEWVEDTEPLGSYLYSNSSSRRSAHERYHPGEWTHRECREAMKGATGGKSGKLAAYTEVCNRLTPVFHHFFLENFREPSLWYQRRISYTRSVAVNSIIGYSYNTPVVQP